MTTATIEETTEARPAVTMLNGHTDALSAYIIESYPYGRLRCRRRCWLEYKAGQGFRFMAQTTDPKRSYEYWNKPKASTYAKVSAAMFLDEVGHVQWNGLTEYGDVTNIEAFAAKYEVAGIAKERLDLWLAAKRHYEARKDEIGFGAAAKEATKMLGANFI